MAFDGIFCYKIARELEEAKDCHIDKIYQPSNDELVFLLRKKGFAKRLLMSVRSGMSRVHFVTDKLENPQTPPMFCQLARKHLSSAKLVGINQMGLDRILELVFEATNELGDRVNIKVVCELIGSMSNIILLNDNGRIIDALRRSDFETAKRIIQPGAVYEYPEKSGKLNILTDNSDDIIKRVSDRKEIYLSRALLDTLDGFSPVICREMANTVSGEDCLVDELENTQKLKQALERVKDIILNENYAVMLKDSKEIPADFTFMPIEQYGRAYTSQTFESYSELLEAFYEKRENEARKAKLCGDLKRTLGNLIARANRRANSRKEELKKCENRETLRIYGELIKANIYLIETGSSICRVQNFYDENLSMVEIPLNPALSPQNNAAHYFKEYKKACVASQTLVDLIEKDAQEIEYLESVSESLSRCEKANDISQIKDELISGGYIKQKGSSKKQAVNNNFTEFKSQEGYRIIVGKNNFQNDYITTKLASKGDMWFHVKGQPGSHVIVFCDGREISNETVIFAATLAAKNSKAKNSSNVPVDYTPVKYVKKPSGAKPGMVIYTTNKTVFVTAEV